MLIRDESFIHIQGWMVTRLGLKGLELMVYACIHGFCNDGESDYHGSRQYLADFCGTSVRNISRCLRSLLDRGLIVQTYHSIDNSEVRYITIVNPSDKLSLGVVTNCHQGSDKMTQGSCQIVTRVVSNCHQGSDKLSPAIKDDNKEDTKEETKADNKVCSARAREHTRPTEKEVGDIVTELKLDGFNVKKFVSFWNSRDWKDKNGQDVSKNLKDRILYWHETELMMKNRSGNLAKVTEPCRPGYQRDQYGVEYMVNDHDLSDEQSSIDELDRLLAEE